MRETPLLLLLLETTKYLPVSDERIDFTVELVRRVAELVVTGEQVASQAQNDKERRQKLEERQKNGDELTQEELDSLKENPSSSKYNAIFEHFFERNGLSMITNIATGIAFDLKDFQEKQKEIHDGVRSAEAEANDEDEPEDTTWDQLQRIDLSDYTDCLLLPPIAIATQAIQSVSILVQNVARATSLFFILSNNHVNQLINFPLEDYSIAERKKQQPGEGSVRRFGSAVLAELTTHFITFLKSLALRMNAETLQFFLTYPSDEAFEQAGKVVEEECLVHDTTADEQEYEEYDEDVPLDERRPVPKKTSASPQKKRTVSVRTVQVEFPLYDRALGFCSAHQDSFVRVTAMNICLNTLRLATVGPSGEDELGPNKDKKKASSPDGVLHNADPLPLRERLAIAQFCCTPSRVERLASPIFTKLAQLWGIFEEQFREMDGSGTSTESSFRKSNDKVAKAKETARRKKATDAFSDLAYNVHDELLLLDDLMKVGLTTLNEQTIEMMFATFVYPLLLQPLLLYFQRSTIPEEILFSDPLNDHSAGRTIKEADITALEKALISAPAKSALFFLSAVFQFISNGPLVRLLFTALLHPMAPDTTGETMIRAKADVACVGPNSEVMIRIDAEEPKLSSSVTRSSYEFGTITGKKCVSGSSHDFPDNDDGRRKVIYRASGLVR